MTDFFSGEGPSKLIIFHQKPTPEEGEDASLWTDEEKVIFVTSGDKETDRMHQHACYFLRNCDGSVDTQTACDDTVLFGELSASPLRSLESALSKVFRPSFEKRDNWGRAEDEQINEFKGSLDKFLAEMQVSSRVTSLAYARVCAFCVDHVRLPADALAPLRPAEGPEEDP